MKVWEDKAKKEFERELRWQSDPYLHYRETVEKKGMGELELLQSFALLFLEDPLPQELPEQEYLIFHGKNGSVPGVAMPEMLEAFEEHEEVNILYGDEDRIVDGKRCDPWFKPDWSPDAFASMPYFGKLVVLRRDFLRKCLEEESAEDTERFLWKIALREDAVPFHLDMIVYNGKDEYRDYPIGHPVPEFPAGEAPLVSLVIPSKDHPELLEQCLKSIRERTQYPSYECIVVDNGSNAENRARVEALRKEYGFCYLYREEEFNFSRMCNRGAAEAKGEVLFFVNDDIEVLSPEWMRTMAAVALQEHVGAVGAKLYYPFAEGETPRIQHVGISNTARGPLHKLCGLKDEGSIYHGVNLSDRDVLAVTAACMAVEKAKFEEIGGFCEELSVAYNDVELCFSLYEKGWYNVQRNDVLLIHHESASRGQEDSLSKRQRQLQEWQLLYERHPQYYAKDPYYSAQLENERLYAEYLPGCACGFERRDLCSRAEQGGNIKDSPRGRAYRKLGIDLNPVYHLDSTDRRLYRDEEGKWMAQWLIEGWAAPEKAPLWSYATWFILQDSEGKQYVFTTFPKYRPDVEPVLPEQEGAALSGFVVRILEGILPDGRYDMALYFKRRDGKKAYCRFLPEKLLLCAGRIPVLESGDEEDGKA